MSAAASSARPQAQRPAPQEQAAPQIADIARTQAKRGTEAFRAWLQSDRAKEAYRDGSLTAALLEECRAIASGADAMRALPDPLADFDPLPPQTPDDEIQARIAAELAARDRALEGGV